MRRTYFALLIFSFLTYSAIAQQAVIRQRAQTMVTSTMNGDFGNLADYTYPKVLQAVGGKEKMVGIVKAGVAQMKSQGVTFKSCTIGQPGPITKTAKAWFSVVPENIVMNANNGELWSSSSLLAVSEDKGKKWTFIDVGNMSEQTLHAFFPDLKGLSIPKQTKPVFHPNKK